jgi:hypothetical protein
LPKGRCETIKPICCIVILASWSLTPAAAQQASAEPQERRTILAIGAHPGEYYKAAVALDIESWAKKRILGQLP